tara:strand:+ start:3489 stop:4481 length:993 start_codon:yes stop_codon:yes gene_type:complete
MAVVDYNNLSALTRDKYIPLLVDNIFESNVLTHRMLRKSKAAASGNKVLQPLEYAKAEAQGFYSGYDVMDTSPTETFTDAVYNWKQAYATISISGKEEMLNDGAERVIDLLEAKVKNAEKSIKDLFGTTLYGSQGDDTDKFVGLQKIIASGRSLGGIDTSSAYTWWDAQVKSLATSPAITYANLVDDSNASYILKLIREMYGSCTVDNDHPSLIVCSQVVFDAYEEVLTAQKRFGASSQSLADAGFNNLLYRGTPIVVDDHVASAGGGHMYFLNEKYLQFRHHRKRNFKFEGFQKPVNQDAAVAKILWLGALTCSNASRQGIIKNMPTTY